MDDFDGLGPVLDEFRHKHTAVIVLAVLGVPLLVAALSMLFLEGFGKKSDGYIALGLATFFLGAAFYTYWKYRGLVTTLHEHGIRHSLAGKTVSMRFADADQVAFLTNRIYVNHSYTITVESLTLASNEPGSALVTYVRKFKDPKQTAGPSHASILAQPVIRRIADRLAKGLARGESVPWYQGATIHPWGLDIPVGGGDTQSIRWEELEEPEITHGIYQLKVVGQKKPVAMISTGALNFFPGLELVESRRATSKS